MRTALAILLPATLALAACNSSSNDAEQAAAAAAHARDAAELAAAQAGPAAAPAVPAAAPAVPPPPPVVTESGASAGVTGFDDVNDHGFQRTFTQSSGGQWIVRRQGAAQSHVAIEEGREGCCIYFAYEDGLLFVADFVQGLVQDHSGTARIVNVVR